MTADEQAEYDVMRRAQTGLSGALLAIKVGAALPSPDQQALDRLVARRWLKTLIEIQPQPSHPAKFRVFKLSREALSWFRSQPYVA